MTPRKPWTDQAVRELRKMAREGITADLMAIQTGRSLKSIHWKLDHLKIPYHHKPKGYDKGGTGVPGEGNRYRGHSSSQARAAFGYEPKENHPDWSNVRFK